MAKNLLLGPRQLQNLADNGHPFDLSVTGCCGSADIPLYVEDLLIAAIVQIVNLGNIVLVA